MDSNRFLSEYPFLHLLAEKAKAEQRSVPIHGKGEIYIFECVGYDCTH